MSVIQDSSCKMTDFVTILTNVKLEPHVLRSARTWKAAINAVVIMDTI